jgi:hypothetical protein
MVCKIVKDNVPAFFALFRPGNKGRVITGGRDYLCKHAFCLPEM